MRIKNLLLAGCVLVLFQVNSQAQLKTEFGLKGGLNYAGLALSSDGKIGGAHYNNFASLHGGVYALLKVAKLGIQPEIIFSRQGQNYTTPNYSNLRSDLNYINIPIIIKYYLAGGLNIHAGPQFGFLTSAKGDLVQILPGGGTGQALLNQDLKSYLNTSDFSFAFGAGIDLPFGASLSIRYNMGLSDINKFASKNLPTDSNGNRISSSFSTASTRNQVLQLSIGYRIFKLGK